jgi:hypothetical protein
MSSRFVNRLPVVGSSAFVDVVVRQGSIKDARNWHALIQPHVAKQAALDAKWHWPRMFLHYSASERLMGRRVRLMCIDIPQGDVALPLARLLLSEGYPSLDGSSRKCVYVWYLAAAPTAALEAQGLSYRPLMALEAIIDTAIQRSMELGYDGRVGLHAHAAGGYKLYCKYRDRARMRALKGAAELTWARRLSGGNDGRYFWSDGTLSKSLVNSLAYLR